MNDDSENTKNLAWAQFLGLRTRATSDWDEQEIRSYHEIVTALETAYGSDLSPFRIPNDRIKPVAISFRRGAHSGRVGPQVQYSKKFYCDQSFARQQVAALDAYLQTLRAARPQGWSAAEAAPPFDAPAQGEPRGYIEVPGPEELVLRIEPYPEGYVWKLRNGSLRSASEACVRITSTQSFDSQKGAFRGPEGRNVQWRIRNLGPGELTSKGIILVRIVGDRLELGETTGLYPLSWPSGDNSNMQRWLLEVRIMGLWNHCTSKLDLRWAAGMKSFGLTRYEDSSGGSEASVPPKTNERRSIQEPVVPIFPGQKYPRYMHHATEPPRLVNSAHEQAELGPEWSETYIFQAYPKCKYSWKEKTVTVQNPEEEAELGIGWIDNPGPFRRYSGPRPAKSPAQDETKWVDEWRVEGLSVDHRKRIKAKLMKAHADFWRSAKGIQDECDAMRQAYTGIAEVLSGAGLLTEGLLKEQIPLLVWDSAIAGGWYRFGAETHENMFPEMLGHYHVWRDNATDWAGLFYSEEREWRAWLLENSTEPDRGANGPVIVPNLRGADVGATDRAALVAERAARRQAVISPILERKGWKAGRLATEAGVSKNCVYEYLDGIRRTISDENRQAVADALGIDVEQLPI